MISLILLFIFFTDWRRCRRCFSRSTEYGCNIDEKTSSKWRPFNGEWIGYVVKTLNYNLSNLSNLSIKYVFFANLESQILNQQQLFVLPQYLHFLKSLSMSVSSRSMFSARFFCKLMRSSPSGGQWLYFWWNVDRGGTLKINKNFVIFFQISVFVNIFLLILIFSSFRVIKRISFEIFFYKVSLLTIMIQSSPRCWIENWINAFEQQRLKKNSDLKFNHIILLNSKTIK